MAARLIDCLGTDAEFSDLFSDESVLDAMLRDVAAKGVWVSAHPDVILKMGAKEVLYRTRHLGWGTDTHLYRAAATLHEEFPRQLQLAGPRVLKQNRGNGGEGVWKVEGDPTEGALYPFATKIGLERQAEQSQVSMAIPARMQPIPKAIAASVFPGPPTFSRNSMRCKPGSIQRSGLVDKVARIATHVLLGKGESVLR